MAVPQLTSNGWINSRPPTSSESTGTREDGTSIRSIQLYDLWIDTSANNIYICVNAIANSLVWQLTPHSSGASAFLVLPTIVGSTTPGTATYSVQAGRYEQIGSQINVIILLAWSGHTGTGNMSIGNLPVSPNTTYPCVAVAKLQNIALPVLAIMTWAKTNVSTGRIDLTASIAGTVDSPVTMSASGAINLNMTYIP